VVKIEQSASINRRFFYNGGLQSFVKRDLKCSIYGPEQKTERFRSIEVIVNFWELVEVGKICVF
jgi:hypothetical protein